MCKLLSYFWKVRLCVAKRPQFLRPIKLIYWERQQIQSTKSLLLQNRCCSTELWCYIIMVAYCCESKQRHICHSVSIGEEYLSKTDSLSVFETSAKCSFIMTRYFCFIQVLKIVEPFLFLSLIFQARLLKKKITQFNLYEIEILFEMHDHLRIYCEVYLKLNSLTHPVL